MILFRFVICVALLALSNMAAAEKPQEIFNGKNLDGWEGNPEVWSVEDGSIVGRTKAESPIANNTFLIWKGGELDDFRLELDYKIDGGNSGVQYRSKVLDPGKWIVGGYQADIDSGMQMFDAGGCSGCNEGYKGRTGIYQVMPMTEEIQKIILAGGSALQIAEEARRVGIRDLRQSALLKAKQGLVSLAEINRVTKD